MRKANKEEARETEMMTILAQIMAFLSTVLLFFAL